jgi:DNA-binding NarL/FixJ family response regulator
MESLRILIADDHPLFRHGIAALLKAEPDFEVVGEATTGKEVIEMADSLQPDVIIMDIHMPEINGIEATRRIAHSSPSIRILIVTMFEDDNSIFSPSIATRMINFFNAPPPAASAQMFPELTEREREILALIAQGQSNTDIARHLVLSPNTVRNYVSNIFSKLQVADRAQAIIQAREAGMGFEGR